MQSTDTLRPIIPNNACPFRITAAAGTKLAGTSFLINVIIKFNERILQQIAVIIHLALLDQTFVHCPIFLTAGHKIAWTLSQFQCG